MRYSLVKEEVPLRKYADEASHDGTLLVATGLGSLSNVWDTLFP